MTTPDIARKLASALSASLTDSPSTRYDPLHAQILDDLKNVVTTKGAETDIYQPPVVAEHLNHLLQIMPDSSLGPIISSVKDDLDWYLIYKSATDWPELSRGMAAGQIIGRRGLYHSETLLAGVMLMAPDIHYPLHQHRALELYHVLSGDLSIRHGRTATPQKLGPGDWSVTPPYQVHALQSGPKGSLILYVWTDEMTDENWWWDEQKDGRWHRTLWKRDPDSSWYESHRELLTRAKAMQAGDA